MRTRALLSSIVVMLVGALVLFRFGSDRSESVDSIGSSRTTLPAQTDTPLASPSARRPVPSVPAVSLVPSPEGDRIASLGEDGVVRVLTAAGQPMFAIDGHEGLPVTSVVFSADGERLLTAGRDSVIRAWSTADGEALSRLDGHEHGVSVLAMSPDGAMLASAGQETRVMLWDAATGRLKAVLIGHSDFVNALSFGYGKLASAGDDGEVLVWNLDTGTVARRLSGHRAPVTSVDFASRDVVVSGASDGTLIVWDLSAGKELARLTGHTAAVKSIAIGPDRRAMVTVDETDRVLEWDLEQQRLVGALSQSDRIASLRFAPTGQLIVGYADHRVAELTLED